MLRSPIALFFICLGTFSLSAAVWAEETPVEETPVEGKPAETTPEEPATTESTPTKMDLSEDRIHLSAPGSWKKMEPSVRILDYEFEVPAVAGEEETGRVTVMGAGGTIKANVDRWVGQFSQEDGGDTKALGKFVDKEIGGAKVHLVDLTGTYKDQRGPFAPATMKKDYRMLAAIIQTEKYGQYFVKFYGPKQTVAANEAAFQKMIEGLTLDKE